MDAKNPIEPFAGEEKGAGSLSLIKHLECIVDATQGKKLSRESLQACDSHLSAVADLLSLTRDQALLLAVFTDQCDDQSIRLCDLARHFDCHNINILCYAEALDGLVARGYIRKREINRRLEGYRMPGDVVQALKKNQPYTPPKFQNLTIQQLFDQFNVLFNDVKEDELTYNDLCSCISELLADNRHLLFTKKIFGYKDFDEDEITLLAFFCHKLVNEEDNAILFYDIENLYDSNFQYNAVKRRLKNGTHALLVNHLIEPKKDNNLLARDCYCLTETACKELLSELNLTVQEKVVPRNIILAKEIAEKSLFYNSREKGQIDQLVSLLDIDNFTKVQKRLVKNGMRKGFACLFYGSPGTGKTETVYQVARQTGRDIMYVNVSEIKSMWVGESEKNIQALFDRYRDLLQQTEHAPILLFNEADAVIGIRQEGAQRAVDKMENSIQNIILQEMEKLEGIMIATTNLTQNLDPAFERRFLFKIEFEKPNLEAKRAIWHSMIPSLSETDATILAKSYDFSGGQIENIACKGIIDHIIRGRRSTLSMLHDYCKHELIHTKNIQRQPIGFRR